MKVSPTCIDPQAWQPGAVSASMSITNRGLLPFGANDSAAGAHD